MWNSWNSMRRNMETYTECCSHKLKLFISFSSSITCFKATVYILKFFMQNVKASLKNMLVCRHPTGPTRNVRVKKIFWCSFLKKNFLVTNILPHMISLAMLTLHSKVNFLFSLLHHFLIVRIFLTFLFLPTALCAGFTRLRYIRPSKKLMEG